MTAGMPAQAAPALHFTENGCMAVECFATHPDDESGEHVAFVNPGDSWDDVALTVHRHVAGHQCAAQQPQPAPGALDVAVEALRVIALGVELNALGLGQPIDPSVTADKALVAIRDLRAADPQPARDLDDLFAEALTSFTQPQPAPELAAQPPSPQPDGTIVIGPQCFADKHREVISWQGENYYALANEDRVLAVGRIDDELATLREVLADLLGEFSARAGDGFRARIGQVQMQRYLDRSAVTPTGRTPLQTPGTQPGQQETNQEGTK